MKVHIRRPGLGYAYCGRHLIDEKGSAALAYVWGHPYFVGEDICKTCYRGQAPKSDLLSVGEEVRLGWVAAE